MFCRRPPVMTVPCLCRSTCVSRHQGNRRMLCPEHLPETDSKTRLITAVKKNDVDSLIRLADTPEWYKYIHPKTGNTLLHFAVWKEREIYHFNKEVFHYLLSFTDFPVNHKNKKGFTVLDFMLSHHHKRDRALLDCFIIELMNKGGRVERVPLIYKESVLHFTIRHKFIQVFKRLAQMGYDVNAQDIHGTTPMWICVTSSLSLKDKTEIATLLLCRGANPKLGGRRGFDPLECVEYLSSPAFQEALFHFMIDDHTSIDLNFHTFLMFAKNRSPFFRDMLEYVDNVIVDDKHSCSIESLFDIDTNNFDAFIKKYPEEIAIAFSKITDMFVESDLIREHMVFKNINLLLESNLRDDTIELMCRFSYHFIGYSLDDTNDSVALQYVYFFLSYGLDFNEYYLRKFYIRYGLDEFLRLVLYNEIQLDSSTTYARDAFLLIFYNVRWSFLQIFEKPSQYCLDHRSQLLHYFSHAKLRELCCRDERPEVVNLIANQPKVPLLVELARNVFRNFLVETFQITTIRHFCSLVNKLPIPILHKKIITLEVQLY